MTRNCFLCVGQIPEIESLATPRNLRQENSFLLCQILELPHLGNDTTKLDVIEFCSSCLGRIECIRYMLEDLERLENDVLQEKYRIEMQLKQFKYSAANYAGDPSAEFKNEIINELRSSSMQTMLSKIRNNQLGRTSRSRTIGNIQVSQVQISEDEFDTQHSLSQDFSNQSRIQQEMDDQSGFTEASVREETDDDVQVIQIDIAPQPRSTSGGPDVEILDVIDQNSTIYNDIPRHGLEREVRDEDEEPMNHCYMSGNDTTEYLEVEADPFAGVNPNDEYSIPQDNYEHEQMQGDGEGQGRSFDHPVEFIRHTSSSNSQLPLPLPIPCSSSDESSRTRIPGQGQAGQGQSLPIMSFKTSPPRILRIQSRPSVRDKIQPMPRAKVRGRGQPIPKPISIIPKRQRPSGLDNDQPKQCEECGKVLSRYSTWENHMNTFHRLVHKYTCPMCDYGCPLSATMRIHMAKHSSERNFVCPVCSRAFKLKTYLHRHMKLVHLA